MTKRDCATYPGCEGVMGSELKDIWPTLEQKGFTIKRVRPENRGGARPGAGPPVLNLEPAAKLNVPVDLHAKFMRFAADRFSRDAFQDLVENYCRVKDIPALIAVLEPPPQTVEPQARNCSIGLRGGPKRKLAPLN